METVPSELVKLECVLSSKNHQSNLPRPCIMMPYSYWKRVTKSNITSPYPTLCIHGRIAMVGPWILWMNRATGRKSFHGPSHDKMGATKPKAPATWVDCCFLSSYFSNIRINYSKICTACSSEIECSCRDMKQYPPRVNRPTDSKNEPRDTPFLGELLCWCYLHNSVPPHILKECGKLLLIQLETLGATKITVLDVDHTNEFARPMPCSWWIVGLATSWTFPVSMWMIQRREYQRPICEEQHETVGNHIYSSWDWPQHQSARISWSGHLDIL